MSPKEKEKIKGKVKREADPLRLAIEPQGERDRRQAKKLRLCANIISKENAPKATSAIIFIVGTAFSLRQALAATEVIVNFFIGTEMDLRHRQMRNTFPRKE